MSITKIDVKVLKAEQVKRIKTEALNNILIELMGAKQSLDSKQKKVDYYTELLDLIQGADDDFILLNQGSDFSTIYEKLKRS